MFEVWENEELHAGIHVIGLLREQEWQHLAIQAGAGGMKLFYNGSLIASNVFTSGFRDLGWRGDAFLGKSAWGENTLMRGALSDVRVWDGLRKPQEISRDLYEAMPSGPAKLVGRWVLDGSLEAQGGPAAAQASSPPHYVPARLPARSELPQPAILKGMVRGRGGQPVDGALVALIRDGQVLAAGASGGVGDINWPGIAGHGKALVAVYATNTPLRLAALHPSGNATVSLEPLLAGEHRAIDLPLSPGPPPPTNFAAVEAEVAAARRVDLSWVNFTESLDPTNTFVRMVGALTRDPRAWMRELAVDALARFPEVPGCATLVSSLLTMDPDLRVREYAASMMARMAPRSTIAAVTLLESGAKLEGITERVVQDNLRHKPIPERLSSVYARKTFATALFFTGLLGAFTVLHSLFFIFDWRNHAAGYTALFTGVGGVGVLLAETPTTDNSFVDWVAGGCMVGSYLLALRLLYCLFKHRLPWRFWGLSWAIAATGAGIWFFRSTDWLRISLFLLALALILATLVEMSRVVLAAWRQGKTGSRLVGLGFLGFAALQMFAPFGIADFVGKVAASWVFPLSLSIFVTAAGIHLAREFVGTHRALSKANEAIAESQSLLNKELSDASAYVRSLLPAPLSNTAVEIAWLFHPSAQLGGDSFGYHPIDEHRYALYLLDVCGHGVSAALLSVSALNLLRSQALPNTDFSNPAEVLGALNRAFPMEAHNQQYFTAWYGVYDPRNRLLRFSAAGHPPAWLTPAEGAPIPLRTPAAPIGCFSGSVFRNDSVTVPRPARLWIVSDGAYEVQTAGGRSLTLEDFRLALAEHHWADPDQLLDWTQRQAGAEQLEDDFSVLRVLLN